INRDGKPDLLYSDSDIIRAWINTFGASTEFDYTQAGIVGTVPNFYQGAMAAGDVDNDGDMDVAVIGKQNAGDPGYLRLLRNDGGSFSFDGNQLDDADFTNGSLAWGDADQDGKMDLVVSGNNNLIVLQNTGAAGFTRRLVSSGLSRSAVAWGD